MILAALAFAGATVVDPAEAAAALAGRRIALLVGPASFADPALDSLRYPDDDARGLAAALADPAVGHFDQIWTLTDPADSSVAGVRAAMAAVGRAVRSPRDTVFVYFSTHGTLAPEERGLRPWLLLADSRLADPTGSGLSQQAVLDWVEDLPSRRRVVIFATCHSGQGKSALNAEASAALAGSKGARPLHEASEATVVIGVCAMQETARESDQLGHDVYTAFLLDALREGDRDGDGAVTVTEAHAAARDAAWSFTGGGQRAWAHSEVLGDDPIVLAGARTRPARPVLGSWQARLAGYRLRVDGEVKGELPGEILVDPGVHRVELLAPGAERVVARQRLRLGEGRRLDADRAWRRDRLRLGVSVGGDVFSIGPDPAPTLGAELHLPRLPGPGWELVATGATGLRWPDPTLSGSLVAEHVLVPGTVQLRAGFGLQGWLLQGPDLLAPSLAPVPSLSLGWLPVGLGWMRLSARGGWLWYTDDDRLHSGWSLSLGLSAGLGG